MWISFGKITKIKQTWVIRYISYSVRKKNTYQDSGLAKTQIGRLCRSKKTFLSWCKKIMVCSLCRKKINPFCAYTSRRWQIRLFSMGFRNIGRFVTMEINSKIYHCSDATLRKSTPIFSYTMVSMFYFCRLELASSGSSVFLQVGLYLCIA